MRVLVTGGRDYRDARQVDRALDDLHASVPIVELIHGDATGADRLAADWARRRGVPLDPHPARWEDIKHPKARVRWSSARRRFYDAAAGHRRNQEMVNLLPDRLVAFPGGPGTADCTARAKRAGIPITLISGA